MQVLFAALLLLPIPLFAQGNCDDDVHPCRGLLEVEHPLLPVEGIPGGVPDGNTWADTSGLLYPGTTGLLVQVQDPGTPNDPELPSDPDLGCAPYMNASEIAGNIAFMERGGCQFGLKALHAQNAGAIGFVIRDYFASVISDELDPPLYMYGGTYGMQVHIPGIIIAYYDGLDLVEISEDAPLNVTLRYRHPAGVDTEGTDPRDRRVSAAFPNPFADQTRFDLSVGKTQYVTAALYDVLGQRVAVLYEGSVTAGSAHRIDFQAQGLPAGVYFVRLVGETFSETRRVVRTR